MKKPKPGIEAFRRHSFFLLADLKDGITAPLETMAQLNEWERLRAAAMPDGNAWGGVRFERHGSDLLITLRHPRIDDYRQAWIRDDKLSEAESVELIQLLVRTVSAWLTEADRQNVATGRPATARREEFNTWARANPQANREEKRQAMKRIEGGNPSPKKASTAYTRARKES